MERTIEEMERQCWEKIHTTLKDTEEQEEQDDSVICDVCRSVRTHHYFDAFCGILKFNFQSVSARL